MLARESHARIERPVDPGGAISLEIEQFPVTYFKNALVDYILTRAERKVRAMGSCPEIGA